MGAAQSSNAASAVSNVSNYINNSTTANTNQVSKVHEQIILNGCVIKLKGDFNARESANLAVKNQQIVDAKQDTNVLNNIQQQILQQATSKVGSLGIGYADASNSSSEFVNSSTDIIQSMNVSANQYSEQNFSFVCDRSYIEANNLNITFSSENEFLSTQTLRNEQTAKIVNDVSQSITQKASATVQGLAAFLIALAILIGVIVYSVLSPLSSGSVKIVVGVVVAVLVCMLLAWMYVSETPPFFNKEETCITNSNIGGCTENCINMKNNTFNLKNPPLRYIYGVSPADMSVPGANLVQMAISANQESPQTPGDNGGYRVDIYKKLRTLINKYEKNAADVGVPNIPNPLKVPQHPANPNQYVQIPVQYTNSAGSGADTTSGICTPKILQIQDGSPGLIKNCATVVDVKNNNLAPTTEPSGAIANLNKQEWDDYLSLTTPPSKGPTDTVEARQLFARFVLCDMIGNIDLHLYVKQNELVKYLGPNNTTVIGLAKDHAANCYYYVPSQVPSSWGDGISGGGKLTGLVGVCNNTTYKLHQFMRKIGVWIMLALFLLAFMYMGYTWYKNRKTKKKE